MTLPYVIVVNDGCELETISSAELRAYSKANQGNPLPGELDMALNAILDARAVADGTYTPEDDDTPIEVFVGTGIEGLGE
ncbi:MAG: hypothetical protein J0I48_19110 [Devosia sp.]|uniref:hypothetical protein n=1 Tax=Devosia sp. 66-22 TaxID=1895753 RepID=UPI000928D9A2|nr:hypothetical protein [Devosia sp. 66-22]MBN9348276.1 hypothetical protein [Devosia sp.]OJX48983.1 MAG: hypothetical protein BGO81_10335 [Devosia sp. 66-22]